MSVSCRLYLQKRGRADAPGKGKKEESKADHGPTTESQT